MRLAGGTASDSGNPAGLPNERAGASSQRDARPVRADGPGMAGTTAQDGSRSDMDAAYIRTMGMSCSGCGRLVEKSIGRLAGVIAVESDQHRGMTKVVFDPDQVDEFHICDRIQRLGFLIRVVSCPQSLDGPDALDQRDLIVGTGSAVGRPGSCEPVDPSGLHEVRVDVHVIHVRTSGLRCDDCTTLVEQTLSHLEGVREVMSVRALGLTSVLFDASLVGRETIVEEIRAAGFGATDPR